MANFAQLEHTGSILVQTLSGILLDAHDGKRKASFQHLINAFILLNTLQAGSIWLLAYQYMKRSRKAYHIETYMLSDMSQGLEAPLLGDISIRRPGTEMEADRDDAEIRRGKFLGLASLVLIVLAWVLFMGVALKEFRQ